MERDSLGQLPRSTSLEPSSPEKTAISVLTPVEQTTRTEIAFLLARILSVCGERRGADMGAMTAEWHDALKFFRFPLIEKAWAEHRNRNPFWPTPADLLTIIRARIGAGPDRTYRAEANCLPLTPEEIERRKALCAKLRVTYGLGSSPPDPIEQRKATSEPAKPDDGTVSESLKAIAKAGGYWFGDP